MPEAETETPPTLAPALERSSLAAASAFLSSAWAYKGGISGSEGGEEGGNTPCLLGCLSRSRGHFERHWWPVVYALDVVVLKVVYWLDRTAYFVDVALQRGSVLVRHVGGCVPVDLVGSKVSWMIMSCSKMLFV